MFHVEHRIYLPLVFIMFHVEHCVLSSPDTSLE